MRPTVMAMLTVAWAVPSAEGSAAGEDNGGGGCWPVGAPSPLAGLWGYRPPHIPRAYIARWLHLGAVPQSAAVGSIGQDHPGTGTVPPEDSVWVQSPEWPWPDTYPVAAGPEQQMGSSWAINCIFPGQAGEADPKQFIKHIKVKRWTKAEEMTETVVAEDRSWVKETISAHWFSARIRYTYHSDNMYRYMAFDVTSFFQYFFLGALAKAGRLYNIQYFYIDPGPGSLNNRLDNNKINNKMDVYSRDHGQGNNNKSRVGQGGTQVTSPLLRTWSPKIPVAAVQRHKSLHHRRGFTGLVRVTEGTLNREVRPALSLVLKSRRLGGRVAAQPFLFRKGEFCDFFFPATFSSQNKGFCIFLDFRAKIFKTRFKNPTHQTFFWVCVNIPNNSKTLYNESSSRSTRDPNFIYAYTHTLHTYTTIPSLGTYVYIPKLGFPYTCTIGTKKTSWYDFPDWVSGNHKHSTHKNKTNEKQKYQEVLLIPIPSGSGSWPQELYIFPICNGISYTNSMNNSNININMHAFFLHVHSLYVSPRPFCAWRHGGDRLLRMPFWRKLPTWGLPQLLFFCICVGCITPFLNLILFPLGVFSSNFMKNDNTNNSNMPNKYTQHIWVMWHG